MSGHCVPRRLIIPGRPPHTTSRHDPQCSHCRARYSDHSGDTCVICDRPVEHHQDRADMELEIRGCARLAEAAEAGGRGLREFELWCLRWVADHQETAA